jgi:hypothetical protein
MTATAVTPVTVLTGFLGSGKTTLLNRLLRDPAAADSAVIVEFGPVAIDPRGARRPRMVLLPSGCVCRVAATSCRRCVTSSAPAGRCPVPCAPSNDRARRSGPCCNARRASARRRPLFARRRATTVDGVHGMEQLDAHPVAV